MNDDLLPILIVAGALFLALDLASFYVIWRVSLRLRAVQTLAARAQSIAEAASVTATATESKIGALDTRVTRMETEINSQLTNMRADIADLRDDVNILARRADLLEMTEKFRQMLQEATGHKISPANLTFIGPASVAGPVAGSIGSASMGDARAGDPPKREQ